MREHLLRTVVIAFLAATFLALPAAPAAAAVAGADAVSATAYPEGQCTWFVKLRRPEIPDNWGNAGQWASAAVASRFGVTTYPVERAIAVFPPFVMGAGPLGHVAFVTFVDGNRRFTIDEANFSGSASYYVNGYPIHRRVIYQSQLDRRVRFIKPRS